MQEHGSVDNVIWRATHPFRSHFSTGRQRSRSFSKCIALAFLHGCVILPGMRTRLALAALLLLPACGGGGDDAPAPPAANQPPQFTSAATARVTENTADAYQATATDAEGNAVTFAIAGGADAARFTLSSTGLLRFAAAPDFDLPADEDGDNVYQVQLSASDGRASTTLDLRVTVTNSREGIQVRRVGTGFSQPLFVAAIPGDSRVMVVEKGGNLIRLDPATGAKTAFMTVPSLSTDGERGLIGLAFSPDWVTSGEFFVYATDPTGDISIRRYLRGPDGLGAPATGSVLLTIPHRANSNHNGGWLGFGPDGLLYAATGDGGGAGDPAGNAQNPDLLLGKILRLARNPAAPAEFIPAPGNPFAAGGGSPFVYALGLRNPFRAAFTPAGLLIGDVGQDRVEEIDLLRPQDAGANFGWPFREGTQAFRGTAPAGLVNPVTEYLHGSGPRQGQTVTGGYLYRGPVALLAGLYVFADFSRGHLWTVPASQLVQGQTSPSSAFQRRNEDFTPNAGTIDQIASFGEDSAGNLYIVDLDGEIFLIGAG